VYIARTGYTGEDGFELMIDSSAAVDLWERLVGDERVLPAGLGARDTLRLEAGMALYGHELTEDVTPFEAGLGRSVRLEKGAFQGSDALTRLSARPPERKLVGLDFEPGAVPRAGCKVAVASKEVGEVASGTFSPTLRHPIATAYVTSASATLGTTLDVSIRGNETPATVVSLPFVPHSTRRRSTHG
jgi:aminomethyltransferase